MVCALCLKFFFFTHNYFSLGNDRALLTPNPLTFYSQCFDFSLVRLSQAAIYF